MNWKMLADRVASRGRYGDTMLAHVNPREVQMLRESGGAGTVNPDTGLYEFYDMGIQPSADGGRMGGGDGTDPFGGGYNPPEFSADPFGGGYNPSQDSFSTNPQGLPGTDAGRDKSRSDMFGAIPSPGTGFTGDLRGLINAALSGELSSTSGSLTGLAASTGLGLAGLALPGIGPIASMAVTGYNKGEPLSPSQEARAGRDRNALDAGRAPDQFEQYGDSSTIAAAASPNARSAASVVPQNAAPQVPIGGLGQVAGLDRYMLDYLRRLGVTSV
jgi:hypothetical protein